MPNLYSGAGSEDTKPQFVTERTETGFPITVIDAKHAGILLREYQSANVGHFNQLEFKARVDAVRDFLGKGLLSGIKFTPQNTGVRGHIFVIPVGGGVQDIEDILVPESSTSSDAYLLVPIGKVAIWVGSNSRYVLEDMASILTNQLGRVYEKLKEDFLKGL